MPSVMRFRLSGRRSLLQSALRRFIPPARPGPARPAHGSTIRPRGGFPSAGPFFLVYFSFFPFFSLFFFAGKQRNKNNSWSVPPRRVPPRSRRAAPRLPGADQSEGLLHLSDSTFDQSVTGKGRQTVEWTNHSARKLSPPRAAAWHAHLCE